MNKLTLPLTLLGFLLSKPFSSIAQTGYIQIVQSAINEESSPDFTYNITGTTNSIVTLNDRPGAASVKDLGATTNGGLWAVAGANATNNAIWYRPANSAAWMDFSTLNAIPNAQRIDGGHGNTFIASTSNGTLLYWDGSALSSVLTGHSLKDVTIVRTNTSTPRIYYIGSSDRVYYRDGINGVEVPVDAYARAIDVDTAGNVYTVGVANTAVANPTQNYVVYRYNANMTTMATLGRPNSIYSLVDIAVADNGEVYSVGHSSTFTSYAFKYSGSTTWNMELNSFGLRDRITGGVAGAFHGKYRVNTNVATALVPETILTKAANGDWIDDNRVRANAVGNTIIIPVAPGTYSVQQNAVNGWWLNKVDLKKSAMNSSVTNIANNLATVTVTDGEMVTVVYQNALDVSVLAVHDCSVAFIETFGTAPGTGNFVSPNPMSGQSSFHHQSNANATMDGYYTITNQSGNIADAANHATYNYMDHTNPGVGNMLLVNASNQREEFFRKRITGLTIGTQYVFSAWIMNVNGPATIKPNVKFEINDPVSGDNINSLSSGNITTAGVWKKYNLPFIATQTEIDVVLRNNAIGGSGNDLAIDDISFAMATDKGDAPDSYVTLVTSGGPCHLISSNLRLGNLIDGEVDGQPADNATGDDNDGLNDDDAITSFPTIAGGIQFHYPSYSIQASVFNNTGANAYVYGWIDWNLNGTFDVDERAAAIVPDGNAQQTVTLTWTNVTLSPTNGAVGTYARIRVGNDAPESGMGANNPSGVAIIGEVEDYRILFSSPLPVNLTTFEAYRKGAVIQLDWNTEGEQNNLGFAVERSADGKNWEQIAWAASKAETGASPKSIAYSLTDYFPLNGSNFYRLKIVGTDEAFEYSPVCLVNVKVEAVGIAPNPAFKQITISQLKGGENIIIYDMAGRKLVEKKSASTNMDIDLTNFPTGVYNLLISENDGIQSVHRFIKN